MDKRDFTIIENNPETKKKAENKKIRQTNPIAKKFVEFYNENPVKFTVRDLFKNK